MTSNEIIRSIFYLDCTYRTNNSALWYEEPFVLIIAYETVRDTQWEYDDPTYTLKSYGLYVNQIVIVTEIGKSVGANHAVQFFLSLPLYFGG